MNRNRRRGNFDSIDIKQITNNLIDNLLKTSLRWITLVVVLTVLCFIVGIYSNLICIFMK